MARDRSRSRGRRVAEPSPNVFSRLVPDVIEDPATAALGGAAGFGGNLLGDVKDAVVGLPMGLVMATKDPLGTMRAVAGATWHTWSPLFRGDVVKFAQQTYDHPLAPILDVAAVFSLGAGAAARGAATLEKAGSTSSAVSKVASLRSPKVIDIPDPTGVRLPVQKALSRRAGRRLVQEGMLRMDPYLPKFYSRAQFERRHLAGMAHRAVTARFLESEALKKGAAIETDMADAYNATFAQAHTALQAAELVEDITEQGKRARVATIASLDANLVRHNPRGWVTPAEAKKLLQSRHYALKRDPAYMGPEARQLVKRQSQLRNKEHAWTTKRDKLELEQQKHEAIRQATAEMANSTERILDEMREANEALRAMQERGHQVGGAARVAHGEKVISKPTAKQLMRYESEAIQEQTDRIARLEKMREESLAAKAKHDAAVKRVDEIRETIRQNETQLKVEGADFVDARERAAQNLYASSGETYEAFRATVEDFGRRATTRKFEHALTDTEGRVLVVPKHDAYQLGLEGGNSLRFLHKLLHKPTMIWKTAVIGYSPRTITNNAVGNWFMYAARELPSKNGLLALKDAMEFRFGKGVTDDALFRSDHWLHRWFSDELADQFLVGNELVDIGKTSAGVKDRLRQGFYPAVHALSERPVRVAAIHKALRDMPEVMQEIDRFKRRGLSSEKAWQLGVNSAFSKNYALREEAALQSRRIAGDYVTLSEGEKWARDLIPFYLWNRHILKTTGNMLLDQPGRLALGARLSDYGIEETEEFLGEIPEFLKGAIPLAALGMGDKTGRANVLLTASLNPFATVGELAESMNAFATGEGRRGAALSQINPFILGAAESVFEQSLLTGTHSPREGSVISDVISRMLLQLPQAKLLEAGITPDTELTPQGNEYLYARDDRSPLSSFLGVPLRDVSLERAASLVAEDTPTTTTRTRTRRSRG